MLIWASNGEHGHDSLSWSCHVCQQEEGGHHHKQLTGSSSYGCIFQPFYHRNRSGQNKVNNIYRKSKGIMKHLPWLKRVEGGNTFPHLFITMHEDICARAWPKAQPVIASLLLLSRGPRGLITSTWASLLSGAFGLVCRCPSSLFAQLGFYGLFYLLLLQPDVPTSARPWPEISLLGCVQRRSPPQVLWVDE